MTPSPNHSTLDTSTDRIGHRLLALRRQSGLSARAAAAMVGIRRAELRAFELGRATVPATTLAQLADLYGSPADALVDERSGTGLRVNPDSVEVGATVRSLSPAASDEEVLQQYLSAVYELRGLPEGAEVPLRDADLVLLADVLGDTTDEIEQRLIKLIHCSKDEARAIRRALLRRKLAAPAAGLVLGVGSLAPSAAAASPGGAGFVGQVLDQVAGRVADAVSAVQAVAEEPPPELPSADVPAPEAPADEPDEEPDEETADEPDEERGEDWAELIPPLVIENPDA